MDHQRRKSDGETACRSTCHRGNRDWRYRLWGTHEQYRVAGEWLDKLTTAIGCERTAVQLVPGNHDIDWGMLPHGCKWILNQIIWEGQAELDKFLANDGDRELLYQRFHAYRPFAEAYNCPLDDSGGRASDRTFDLAPGRKLRFIGFNSALACWHKDGKGTLFLGCRQHVLPRNDGEELVVLSHHPLEWLRDSDEARQYIQSRARVLVTGHEHNPSYIARSSDNVHWST